MKLVILLIIFGILSNVDSKISSSIESRGQEAMVSPASPYSDFEAYQEAYEKEYGKTIEHPMMGTFTRPTEKSVDDSELIDLIVSRGMYIGYLASFGHCFPDIISRGLCKSTSFPNTKMDDKSQSGWILVNYGTSTTPNTISLTENNHYAILRNDIFKKVVITYPGTKDLTTLTAEGMNSNLIIFSLQRFSRNARISEFFGTVAECIMEDVFTEENIKNMKLAEGYQIIFTGHSLGGAVAAATLFFALDRGLVTRELNHPVLATYGQPRTGNEDFALILQSEAEVVYRYANSGDIVPQVPPYLLGYRHTNGEIYMTGDRRSFAVESSVFNYDLTELEDRQTISTAEMLMKVITNLNRHLYYFGYYLPSQL